MSNLVESILSEDYVSASNIFESRLNEIAEKKLIEMKKMLQTEITGGLTKADIAKRRKAGYVRASEVLPDPRDIEIKSFESRPSSGKKIVAKRKKRISEALSDTDIERIGRERQAAQQADLQRTFKVDRGPSDETTKERQDRLVDMAKDAKGLKAAPRSMRVPHKEIIAGGEREKRAKELKARGSKQAAKWLRATKTQRNVAGLTHTLKSLGKGLAKGFADNSPI